VDIPLLNDSPIERGERLRKVRHLAGLNAEELAQKIGYSRQTISYWENATHSGLSHKGAKKVIDVVKEMGVHCDMNWLLYGIGDMLTLSDVRTPSAKTMQVTENQRFQPYQNQPPLLQEIELFKQINQNAVIAQIKHNAMQPAHEPGDWVGGCFESIHADLLGIPCIVEIDGVLDIRVISQGDRPGIYNLQFLNSAQNAPQPVMMKNVLLKEVAKIIRVWRD
jgi:transcriptional regulator with XRE-family HTH domain